MLGFFRWFIAIPLAALVTVTLFLLIYNQIAPEPFIYRSPENSDKIVIDLDGSGKLITICDCFWFQLPERPDGSNAWTRSDKAVTDPPRVPSEKPEMPVTPKRVGPGESALRACNGEDQYGDGPIVRIPPPYPRACVEKRAEGVVVVEFDITAEGRVTNASIIESVDQCFNAAVLKLVSGWRYPAMCDADGKPVARYGRQEVIRFELED